MQLFVSNKTKYDIKINHDNINVFLKSGDIKKIDTNNNPFVFSVSMYKENEKGKAISKKVLKTLSNLLLNVECTYKVDCVCNNLNISIIDNTFEVENHYFLLPFGYHYPVLENMNYTVELVCCNGTNTKQVLRLYRLLALFGEGGYGLLLSCLFAFLQSYRIQRLCKANKILVTLKHTEKKNTGDGSLC